MITKSAQIRRGISDTTEAGTYECKQTQYGFGDSETRTTLCNNHKNDKRRYGKSERILQPRIRYSKEELQKKRMATSISWRDQSMSCRIRYVIYHGIAHGKMSERST